MTREEAIKELKEDIELYIPLHGTIDDVDRDLPDGRLITALEMGIKALEQEPKTDSWSIKDVADTFKKHGLIREQEPCEDWYDVPSDEMTLEQARQAVKDLRKKLAEYLEQEPCPNAISRQAVINLIRGCNSALEEPRIFNSYNSGTIFQHYITELPPVNPQPKTGHWIFDEILDKHYYCSECKSMGVDYWDYCPNCGAKMVEPQEGEVDNGNDN